MKIGEFITLPTPLDWGNVAYNVQAKFPASRPWLHWGVGDWHEYHAPERQLTDDEHEKILTYLDGIGVDVFLEARQCGDVVAFLDTEMKKWNKHPSVKGFGFDLEFFKGGCGGAGAKGT